MNPLLWMFQFAFGCHHRHLSRIFTIKKRTYKVCFDCGTEFDMPDPYSSLILRDSPRDSGGLGITDLSSTKSLVT
jgi:hypothetical protein